MTGQPAPSSSEPWEGMECLPVPPPYTPDDLQAIVDALRLDHARLWTIAVPRPGVRVVMGEPCPPGPLFVICCPLADAIQDSARMYLSFVGANARPSRGPSRQNLTKVRGSAQQLIHAVQTFTADLHALDSTTHMAVIKQAQSPFTQYQRWAHLEAQARTWSQEIAVQLTWLLGLVEPALQSVERDTGGRPPDTPLHVFIKRLGFLYEWATGKPPGLSRQLGKPSGPLFRFIDTCFTLLTPHWGEACNAEALYEQIRTVLNLQRRSL
jgi:hypothetical protein